MSTEYKGRFLEMHKTDAGWEYCSRVADRAAVMIFAMTEEGKIILVEEFRPPIGAACICFPAGLHGDEGEEAYEHAAQREFFEEAGYEAAEMQYLFTGPSSPGLSSEMVCFYLAKELRKTGAGGGVDSESITLHEVDRVEIDSWLKAKIAAGISIDPRVYTGLYFLLHGE